MGTCEKHLGLICACEGSAAEQVIILLAKERDEALKELHGLQYHMCEASEYTDQVKAERDAYKAALEKLIEAGRYYSTEFEEANANILDMVIWRKVRDDFDVAITEARAALEVK
jgi:hypothetical protein